MLGKIARRLLNRGRTKKRAPECRADFTAAERATLKKVRRYTLTSPERVVSLCRAVEHIVRWQIPGDFVECGVWRGGSMLAIADTLVRLNDTSRRLWLYDTFEGMTPPTDEDKDFTGRSAESLCEEHGQEWVLAPLDVVKNTLSLAEYPSTQITYVQGKVEDTLPGRIPGTIALLRLDTDWYESTRHELAHLYPRLSSGGILIIDDYGHFIGAQKAVDEYVAENKLPLFLSRIDYTGRLTVKP